jgi:hypothetical protein
MFIEYAGYSQLGGSDYLAGFFAAADRTFSLRFSSAASNRAYGNGGTILGATNPVAGNIAVVGDDGYFDGAAEGGSIPAWNGAADDVYIGARNNAGSDDSHITADIAAVVFYNDDAAAVQAQASAINTAMGEL